MGKLFVCTDACICNPCCKGNGVRANCLCPCNKCACARTRAKRATAGFTPKQPDIKIQHTTSFKIIRENPADKHKLPKQYKPPKTPTTRKITHKPNEYPKEVEEHMYAFSYNDQLRTEEFGDNIAPTQKVRVKPLKSKGIYLALYGMFIVASEGNYATFKSIMVGKILKVTESMWTMPMYNPETAAISKAKWAVIIGNTVTKTCSCSCDHARNLIELKKDNLKCWHIILIQENSDELQSMEVCDIAVNSTEEERQEEDEEDIDIVLDSDIVTGTTRSGVIFNPSSSEVVEEDTSLNAYKLPDMLQWLVVDDNNNYCWVFFSQKQQRLKCRTAHPNSPLHRSHAAAIHRWTQEHMDENWKPKQPQSTSKIPQTFPLSYLPIKQSLQNDVRARLKTETEQNCPTELHPEPHLLPSKCTCGHAWKSYDELYEKGMYFTLNFKKWVLVYYRKCVANKCTWHFDGQDIGIFNYSGKTLVSYSLLKDYHNCCVKGSMSWTAYVDKMNSMYNEVYCEQDKQMDFLSQPSFVKVMVAYMSLTVKTLENPVCPCCGQYPKKLIMDGTDAGLAFRHLQSTYRTWITEESPETDQEVVILKDRCFLASTKARKWILEYCKDPNKFNRGRWKVFVRRVRFQQPGFAHLLENICKEYDDVVSNTTLPKRKIQAKKKLDVWLPLLKVLSSFNSICPLMSQDLVYLAHAFAAGTRYYKDLTQHAAFAKTSPLITKIMVHFGNYWPKEYRPLLKEITRVCQAPFEVSAGEVEYLAEVTNLEFWEEGHWYPHWHKLRSCKKYSNYHTKIPEPAAGEVRWQKYFEATKKNHANDGNCRKADQATGSNRFQVPGVFIICCEHGVIYGFHMMIDPEGRKDLFYVLYERMPQEILSNLTVIYDFACNALEYCLNREPIMFKHTKFLVDRFHYLGHKCCRLFSMDHYPHLHKINSSILESINSFVQGFRQQLSQMNQRNYMLYLQYLFITKNQVAINNVLKSVDWAL